MWVGAQRAAPGLSAAQLAPLAHPARVRKFAKRCRRLSAHWRCWSLACIGNGLAREQTQEDDDVSMRAFVKGAASCMHAAALRRRSGGPSPARALRINILAIFNSCRTSSCVGHAYRCSLLVQAGEALERRHGSPKNRPRWLQLGAGLWPRGGGRCRAHISLQLLKVVAQGHPVDHHPGHKLRAGAGGGRGDSATCR